MMRTAAMALVVGASLTLARVAVAQPQQLLVAGSSEVAFIDADDDGKDSDDCTFGATVGNSGEVEVIGSQPDGPNKLVPCTGNCAGDGFVSSDFLEITFDDCSYSDYPFVPTTASFCNTIASCMPSSSAHSGSGAGAGASGPLKLVSGLITQPGNPAGTGFGNVCAAGGPAAKVTVGQSEADGVTMLKELAPYPNPSSPTHLCVPDFPVQLVSGGFVLRPACFPVRPNLVADIALSGSPSAPFAFIDFGALPGCNGGARAPTTSEAGLAALCVALLFGGTWMLARRRSFAGVLPLL
ncbi:MAG: hypothetical protein SF182_27795 [Deltaproteobacteria bacterium]|nr:hypothetical protein [Deltaproteobacteria bacterium]